MLLKNRDQLPSYSNSVPAGGSSKKHSEKDIKNEILILIHMLEEDPETENAMREALVKAEKYEKEALENFLELMVSKEYQSIFDIYK